MTKADILPAWDCILRGYTPLLPIEITKECPLRCPGCYAYEPGHLKDGITLRQMADLRGGALVNGVPRPRSTAPPFASLDCRGRAASPVPGAGCAAAEAGRNGN